MTIKQVGERTRRLILQPESEWSLIGKEQTTQRQVWQEYVRPLIVWMVLLSLLGALFFHAGYGINFSYLLASTFYNFTVVFGTVYLSSLLIREITPNYILTENKNQAVKLVLYSSSAFILSSSFSALLNIPPLNSLLTLCGVYSFYLFWLGIPGMLGMSRERRNRFAVVSILIILGIYLSLQFLFEAILSGPLSGKNF